MIFQKTLLYTSFPFMLVDDVDDKIISCENGHALSYNGDFCHDSQECPISAQNSILAMSSNCSKMSNHFCPLYDYSSKICMDKVNVSITDYCSWGGLDEPWICPEANKGLKFEQCYDM